LFSFTPKGNTNGSLYLLALTRQSWSKTSPTSHSWIDAALPLVLKDEITVGKGEEIFAATQGCKHG
jgi:hypothetical protein